MAIDLDAIRNKLNQLSGNNSRRNTMWRPQEGIEPVKPMLRDESGPSGIGLVSGLLGAVATGYQGYQQSLKIPGGQSLPPSGIQYDGSMAWSTW